MPDFHGLPTSILSNSHLRLEYLATAGPRIVRLFVPGMAENLLAESPEVGWDTPYGVYSLRGGHRLWLAPERLGLSDVPDDDGLQVEELPGGVRLVGPVEAPTGVVKTIEIYLNPERAELRLRHALTNHGNSAIEMAAWVVTQLPLGGVAAFPQGDPSMTNLHQPDRSLMLWPDTAWGDPRIRYQDGVMYFDAQPSAQPAKWGYLNWQGWISYTWQGITLRKHFDPQPRLPHPDLGCNVEFYIKDQYVELETLGPLVTLAPGEATWHEEVWEIIRGSG